MTRGYSWKVYDHKKVHLLFVLFWALEYGSSRGERGLGVMGSCGPMAGFTFLTESKFIFVEVEVRYNHFWSSGHRRWSWSQVLAFLVFSSLKVSQVVPFLEFRSSKMKVKSVSIISRVQVTEGEVGPTISVVRVINGEGEVRLNQISWFGSQRVTFEVQPN